MKLIEALAAATRAAQTADSQKGRELSTLFSIATNFDDPDGFRRLKTTSESKGGLAEMDWAMRVLPCPYWDPPLPSPGMSLATSAFGGDPHDMSYQGVMVNRVNPPFSKSDPVADDWRWVPGVQTLQIGGDRLTEIGGDEDRKVQGDRDDRTEQDHTIRVGKRLKLQNDAGAYIELTESGHVVICDAFDRCITLGGSGINWDLNGSTLNFVNAGDVAIAGKSVIVVGSKDSDNDTNNQRGY